MASQVEVHPLIRYCLIAVTIGVFLMLAGKTGTVQGVSADKLLGITMVAGEAFLRFGLLLGGVGSLSHAHQSEEPDNMRAAWVLGGLLAIIAAAIM